MKKVLTAIFFLSSAGLLAIGQAWPAGAPSAPQIKQASVNGVTLVYQEHWDGAPVVFIHGCCTDYRAWDAQRQAIAPHYRFIGLNMRYFGTAPWPDHGSKFSHQMHADDIAAFIRGLNASPVDLVGWSYSGPIVMLVLLQHPDLVHSLTIHEPGSLTYVTDPAIAKIAGEDRMAAERRVHNQSPDWHTTDGSGIDRHKGTPVVLAGQLRLAKTGPAKQPSVVLLHSASGPSQKARPTRNGREC